MNIFMLSHGYPPTISGVSLVVQKVARALVKRGHNVTVLSASDRGVSYRSEDEGVHLIRVKSRRNPVWTEGPIPTISRAELLKIIRETQPEIIHTHENALLSLHLLKLKRELRVPIIASCYFIPRFASHYLRLGSFLNNINENLIWKYAIWNFNQFNMVVFSTATQRQYFLDNGLNAQSIVISNGVDNIRYHPSQDGQEQVEKMYQLPPSPRVLFVSRMARDKKIEILLEAMHEICTKQETHLLLVGRGDDRERLENIINKLNLKQYVHMLGFIPEEDLPALYRSADIFAISSVCEVQSIPTLQAAVTGLPVVSANAAALPELVQDGVNGFLVQPNNAHALSEAILKIINNPETAKRFGQASLAIGAQHAESATFQAFEDLYKQMLSNT